MYHIKKLAILVSVTLIMACAFNAVAPRQAYADTTTTTAVNPDNEVCTSFGARAAQTIDSKTQSNGGLLTEIYTFIKTTMGDATQRLFQAFTTSSVYQNAVTAAMTLMVIFYAVGFTIGVVQPSFQQVLIRLVKIAVIGAVISPTGWQFFSDNVVNFFQDGSDYLINGVQAIGFGVQAPAGASPFYALDIVSNFLINPDTIVAIIGAFGAGGPFGLGMSGLLLLAMFSFFKLILKTLELYAVTFVARSLVLGVAPIFFVFLLFDRTKNMFIAWVNALLNLSLQPIIMFTFLSFFLILIQTSAQDMLGAELCWHEFGTASGTTDQKAFWRFMVPAHTDPTTGKTIPAHSTNGDMTWSGSLECLVSPGQKDKNACPDFPLNVLDMLSFLILVYLATKFADVTKQIANELSNAVVNLDNQGKLEQMLEGGNKQAGNSVANINPKASGQPTGGATGNKPPPMGTTRPGNQ